VIELGVKILLFASSLRDDFYFPFPIATLSIRTEDEFIDGGFLEGEEVLGRLQSDCKGGVEKGGNCGILREVGSTENGGGFEYFTNYKTVALPVELPRRNLRNLLCAIIKLRTEGRSLTALPGRCPCGITASA